MAGYGAGKGLAFVNDWEGDLDRLYKRAEYDAQLQTEKQRKTAYYGELLKKGHGTNPRTEAELNDFYTNLNGQLADFFTENPNFETDPVAYQKFLDIQDRYLNNDILREDLQVGQEFEKLKQAYNSREITREKFDQEMERYNSYIDPDKKGDPYVFSNPRIKTSNELLDELSKTIGYVESDSILDTKSLEYYTETKYDPVRAENDIRAALTDEENRLIMERDYQTFIEANPGLKSSFPTIESFWKDKIKNMMGTKRNYIGPAFRERMALEAGAKRNAMEEEGAQYLYISDEYDQIASIMEDPVNSEDKVPEWERSAVASPAAITFTDFKSLNKKTTISPTSNAWAIQTDGTPIQFKHNISAKATNIGKYRNINGSLYLEVDVQFQEGSLQSGMGGNSLSTSGLTAQKLKDMGFKLEDRVVTSEFDVNTGASKVSSAPTWEGKLLLPADSESIPNMIAFEKEYSGIAHGDKAAPVISRWANATRQQREQAMKDPAMHPKIDPTIAKNAELTKTWYKDNYGITIDPGMTDKGINEQITKDVGVVVRTLVDENGVEYLVNTETGLIGRKKR